ncbi:MAG: YiiX/YebB-like N1pC/P60 family cysteine hydrolase [Pseudobdellovibrionaceae bacterium]
MNFQTRLQFLTSIRQLFIGTGTKVIKSMALALLFYWPCLTFANPWPALPGRSSVPLTVAFLEIQHPDGSLWRPEPNSELAHVALYHADTGLWLHAAPRLGVKLSPWTELSQVGKVVRVVQIKNRPSPKLADFIQYLGRPYDFNFSWNDEALYCSELIGKILNISPRPMFFDPQVWPSSYQKLNGQPGISPQGIYDFLTKGS